MNNTEAVALVRKVRAYCPSQHFDEYTPEAWAEAFNHQLADAPIADALEAVRNIGSQPLEPGRARYIDPGHIIGEVKRIRARRMETTPMPEPPADLTPTETIAWQKHTRKAIADGQSVDDTRPQLEARQVNLAGITKTTTEA